jgi:hypothetical protein
MRFFSKVKSSYSVKSFLGTIKCEISKMTPKPYGVSYDPDVLEIFTKQFWRGVVNFISYYTE